jgi:dipeptidyl aminopeptidase/acylaminoacyl peptidase
MRTRLCIALGLVAASQNLVAALPAVAKSGDGSKASQGRAATTDDILAVKFIDAICTSHSGGEFAFLARQADLKSNRYRSEWMIGSVRGTAPQPAGDGGDARLFRDSYGFAPSGDMGGGPCFWAPDDKAFAYLRESGGEVQLWESTVGGAQRRLTSHPGDVREFAWKPDGRSLIYTASQSRASIAEERARGEREGYRIDEFIGFHDMIFPGVPTAELKEPTLWAVDRNSLESRPATASEIREFDSLRRRGARVTGVEANASFEFPHASRGDGAIATLTKVDLKQTGPLPVSRIMAMRPGGATVGCKDPRCEGQYFFEIWWLGDDVIFRRWGGATSREERVYAWNLRTGRVSQIYGEDGARLTSCDLVGREILCIRELPTQPPHIFALDVKKGTGRIVADINPQLRTVKLGRVERIEWDLPEDEHKLGFPTRARAYVIYPPAFDPNHKYPVFIAPYATGGFLRGDVGDEHPLFAYAANGMIVINSEFPAADMGLAFESVSSEAGLFSQSLGFPHLTMIMASTFRALDVLLARGVVDQGRVGIGGVSTGAFGPLWMMMHADRLAAVAIGGPGWSESEPYVLTRRGREALQKIGAGEGFPQSKDYWAELDAANHVNTFEAPLLLHMAAKEAMFGPPVLIRKLDDANLPYEAYVFQGEGHLKTQPDHRIAIYNRNLDWFRFWLQDVEDSNSEKSGQYERWRKLRGLQCRNPRSTRDYCNVVSTFSARAR